MDREEAKEYIKANPEIYFKRARKSGYICPICQNGRGKDGTGIKEIKGKERLYKCFKCEFSGDVFGFIAKENNLDIKSDFPKIMDIARSIYGIALDNASVKKNASFRSKRQTPLKSQNQQERTTEGATDAPQTDYTDFFNEAHKHLNESDYLTKRGISEETQNKFNIGYCKEWKHPEKPKMMPSERIIIPTSKHSYMARATNEDKEQYKAMKVGNIHIFNVEVLEEESQDPIFVCEGEIDALSVIETDGKAVGLGGVGNIELLMSELERNREAARNHLLILCLDADEAGSKATNDLSEKLKEKGFISEDLRIDILSVSKDTNASPKEKPKSTIKDPNEALIENREAFRAAVKAAKSKAQEAYRVKLDNKREEYLQARYSKLIRVLSSFEQPKRSVATGMNTLDSRLDGGLHAGLYVLAAASGAGKTTFALQIADYMSKNGQDVLFFSGEMTINEIVAKSLSRLSKETSKDNDRNALTMRTVLNLATCNNPDYKAIAASSTEIYTKEISNHLGIYDGRLEIADIFSKIENHKLVMNANPIVFLDYLQIIQNSVVSKYDRRLQIDEIVSQLRILAAKYETPIFVISSLNRTAYGREKTGNTTEHSDEKDIYMADLKESGGIEYGADVIITLQAEKENDKDNNNDDVRKMKLRVIKNRTGKRHNKGEYISLDFHCRFNYFESQQETTNKQNDKKEIQFIGDEVVK